MSEFHFPDLLFQPIHLKDSLELAGKKIFCDQFTRLINLEAGTQSGEDREILHQMRTAVRRLRTGLRSWKERYGTKKILPHLNYLRQVSRLLGSVRDLDTFILFLESIRDEISPSWKDDMETFIADRNQERGQNLTQVIKELESSAYSNWKQDFYHFLVEDNPENLSRDWVKAEVPILLRAKFEKVLRYRDKAFTSSLKELHRLRIYGKRFRYMVEFFRKVYDKRILDVLKELVQLQDLLGEYLDKQRDVRFLQHLSGDLIFRFPSQIHPDFLTVVLNRLQELMTKANGIFIEFWRNFSLEENTIKIQYILRNAVK